MGFENDRYRPAEKLDGDDHNPIKYPARRMPGWLLFILMAVIEKEAPRDSVGQMPGIVTNKGLAKAIGERASAEQGGISRWWQGTGRYVTRG